MTQTVTPELKAWIIEQAQAGCRPDTVLAAMRSSGWDEDVALDALNRQAVAVMQSAEVRQKLQEAGMTAGINALIVGNYLTTLGRSPDEDLDMLERLSMPVGALSKVV